MMARIDVAKLWSMQYRLTTAVIANVAPAISALGIEVKELFVLMELDDHPHPAELAEALLMPKPTVTVHVKHLEASGFVKRAIDSRDLRRHRLTLTPAGRKVMTRGLGMLNTTFSARLDRLSAADQEKLAGLLETLLVPVDARK